MGLSTKKNRQTKITSQIKQPEQPLPDWEEAGVVAAFGGEAGFVPVPAGGVVVPVEFVPEVGGVFGGSVFGGSFFGGSVFGGSVFGGSAFGGSVIGFL